MTRTIHHSAVILSSLLLFSACEKKNESTSQTSAPEESGPGKSTKSTKTDRHAGTRSERQTAAKNELREALEAAQSETDPATREKALSQVAWDAIDIDRAIAQQAFAGLTRGSEESRKLIAHFAMRMADDDPEAALEWARNLEDAKERDEALGRVAAVIADKNPGKAATLALEEIPEGPIRAQAVIQVAQRWTQTNPAKTGEWLATLPAGLARRSSVVVLARSWSETDAAGFGAWAAAHESQFPEMVPSVATVFRSLPDEKVRAERISKIADPVFRQRVEDEIKRAAQEQSFK